jgi:hypothetical protein
MSHTQELLAEPLQPIAHDHHWPLAGRVGFRFVFSYFMLYLFCNGNVTVFTPFDRIPWVGGAINGWFSKPFHPLTEWLGHRLFHLTGVAAAWHAGGSGDTAQGWILEGVFLLIAIAATLLWSVLDRKRGAYPTLYAWLRFSIRLMLGVSMLVYGFAKVFPLQMQPPSIGVLNEPFGQLSPMSVLWSMLAIFPVYQMICGWAEVIAGALLLVRKTALAGALLTSFVMTNVLLYNLFFDVPVKLFAAHLVLFAVFLILADAPQLFRFFILNQAAQLKGIWVPPASRAGMLRAMWIVEICYFALAVVMIVNNVYPRWTAFQAGQQPSPIVGAWTVTAASPAPLKTPEANPWTDIYFDNTFRAMVRGTDGQLWRYSLKYDAVKKTVDMISWDGTKKFIWKVNDPDHLTLTAAPAKASPAAAVETLQLTRQPTAKNYVLYDRGFHLVNEWGYEH